MNGIICIAGIAIIVVVAVVVAYLLCCAAGRSDAAEAFDRAFVKKE
ncbi:MAG: hypothetical protein N3A02_05505 [Rectinema sp.]|nr:hypothetical protein [Rectinema sp.]